MKPSEIIDWALAHGFRKTGPNAYSAMHDGGEYQMLLRPDEYRLNRKNLIGGRVEGIARGGYEAMSVDGFGMLRNAGLDELFVRGIWHSGKTAPVWFTPEYTAHALGTVIPEWEAKLAKAYDGLKTGP